MAKKPVSNKKTSTKSSADSGDNVVRIKAGSSAPKKDKVAKEATVVSADSKNTKVVKSTVTKSNEPRKPSKFNIFASIGGYFKGAWVELRQVRWPTRRATWSLTGAVLVYSAFFVVLVLLLDAGFKYMFELILGK